MQHWGFTRIPFPKNVPGDSIFRSKQHLLHLAALDQVLLTREIGVVVGESGTGKTTLITDFTALALDQGYRVIHLSMPQTKISQLYRGISQALGVDTTIFGADALKVIGLLSYSYAESKRANILVVDEAHLLSLLCLNELRLLTNQTYQNESLLSLALFGQTDLASKLKVPDTNPLTRRVTRWVTLAGLDEAETADYIAWHLQIAGQSAEVFAPSVIKSLARRSQGNPRMINRLAWECLNQACLDETRMITDELYAHVCRSLGPHLRD